MDQGNQQALSGQARSVIVGFGRIANTISEDKKMARYFPMASHAQVIDAHPGFELTDIVDPAIEGAAKIEDVDAEFAVLAIPPEPRLDVIKALPSLKAVLVEKPMGDEKLLEYCEDKGIAVHVNFWRRGDTLYRELADWRLKKLIGTPQAVFCTYGNGLYNNGSHLVDFLRMLLGEVTDVTRTTEPKTLKALGCSSPNIINDFHVGFHMVCGGIPVSVLPLDFEHYREVGVDIWGAKGRLTLYQESLLVCSYKKRPHRGMTNQNEIDNVAPLVLKTTQDTALYNIYDSILSGDTLSSGRNALETHRVLDAVIHG